MKIYMMMNNYHRKIINLRKEIIMTMIMRRKRKNSKNNRNSKAIQKNKIKWMMRNNMMKILIINKMKKMNFRKILNLKWLMIIIKIRSRMRRISMMIKWKILILNKLNQLVSHHLVKRFICHNLILKNMLIFLLKLIIQTGLINNC